MTRTTNMRKILKILGFSLLGIAVVIGFLSSSAAPNLSWHTNSAGAAHKMTVYKSATCGCCTIHADYMQSNGYKVETIDTEGLEAIKNQYNIPAELWSCHTTIVNDGEYYIEGHIPIEAIEKLLEEESEIAGIGMPGMPSGSPGMPGPKYAPFDVMQVNQEQDISLFESI